MKDEKILEGGQDLAGRGVYMEKMWPFPVNGLIHTRTHRHSGPVCITYGNRFREQLRPLNFVFFFIIIIIYSQGAEALHLFPIGTTAVRGHVGMPTISRFKTDLN